VKSLFILDFFVEVMVIFISGHSAKYKSRLSSVTKRILFALFNQLVCMWLWGRLISVEVFCCHVSNLR